MNLEGLDGWDELSGPEGLRSVEGTMAHSQQRRWDMGKGEGEGRFLI